MVRYGAAANPIRSKFSYVNSTKDNLSKQLDCKKKTSSKIELEQKVQAKTRLVFVLTDKYCYLIKICHCKKVIIRTNLAWEQLHIEICMIMRIRSGIDQLQWLTI